MLLEDFEDVLADFCKLGLDLLPVPLDHGNLVLVAFRLLLLLDGGYDAPRRSTGTYHVLVGDRKEVALFHRQLLVGRSHTLHVLHHLYICSLAQLRKTRGHFNEPS